MAGRSLDVSAEDLPNTMKILQLYMVFSETAAEAEYCTKFGNSVSQKKTLTS